MLTPIMSLHLATVAPAAVLGAYLMLRSKGTPLHRLLGKIYMALMMITALLSCLFAAVGPQVLGHFRPDSLAVVARAVFCAAYIAAKKHNVTAHKGNMIGVYVGGILVAGLFTLTSATCISCSSANQTSELCLYSALSRIRQKDPRRHNSTLRPLISPSKTILHTSASIDRISATA